MIWKSKANSGDHVWRKLPDISYFMFFLSWDALKHFKTVRKLGGILEWGLLHVITRSIAEMIDKPSFTKIHSHKKEMQLSNFLKGWISVTLHVLKLQSIAKEPRTIFERGFLHIVTKSIDKLKCTTKFIYLHSSAKETQLSTVRFFWDWV